MIPLHTCTRQQMVGLAATVVLAALFVGLLCWHLTGGLAIVIGDEP